MVAPPPVGNEAEDAKPKQTKAAKRKSDAAACGALVGAAFASFSLLICNDFSLAADDAEEQKIGGALAKCLDTLPGSWGARISMGGPWIELTNAAGGAILKRIAMVRNRQMKVKPTPEKVVDIHTQGGVPKAPDPGQATQPQRAPGEIWAPKPVGF